MQFSTAALRYVYICSSVLLAMTLGNAQRGNRQMMPPADISIGEIVPDDLVIYKPDGSKTTLKDISKDRYTVLVTGCLTCPVFHRTYVSTEAIFADYKDRDDIQFFFVYKSLAHPELNGYVQPVTLDERLQHIVEAKRVLGTTIPWLCDGPDNAVRQAFNLGPNSDMIIDPSGILIHASRWTDSGILRREIVSLVGDSSTHTTESEVNLMRQSPHRAQRSYEATVLPKPAFSSELIPVLTKPVSSSDELFYVKPRIEVDMSVLRNGEGEMYLGFYPDPIHGVHWNNLVDPVRFELNLPQGTTISPSKGSAPEVNRDSDGDPREFKLQVASVGRDRSIELTFHYYACSVAEGWCRPVSQTYLIQLVRDPDGGGTMGRSFRFQNVSARNQRTQGMAAQSRQGSMPRNASRSTQAQQIKQRVMGSDSNADGKITRDELPPQMQQRFQQMDSNGDGFITEGELDEMLRRRFGNNRPERRP